MQESSNHKGVILARMNGRNAGYRFVTEGENLIRFPSEATSFVRYFPEESEEEVWYYLDNIRQELIPCPPGISEARLLTPIEPEDLRTGNYQYLAYLDGKGNILYQITPKGFVLRDQPLIEIGADMEIHVVKAVDRIVLGLMPDLIQCQSGSRTILMFQKIRKVFKIAPEIVGVYQALKKDTVQTFLDSGLVYLCGFEPESIGRANLRRLHEINTIMEGYNDEEMQEVREYISRMFPKLYYNEKRKAFAIENNSNLRDVLYCLRDQAFLRYRDGEVCIAPHYFVRERRK